MCLQFRIAVAEQLPIILVQLKGLLEREQVLLTPVAVQGAGDLGLGLLAPLMTPLRQLPGSACALVSGCSAT
jgi:hypothetical protein